MQEPDVPVEEEWVQEQKLLPQEYWEEEPVERVEYKTVTEERAVPQVKALYAFQGQDIDVAKGEVRYCSCTYSCWLLIPQCLNV
jgi:hypothetical protein